MKSTYENRPITNYMNKRRVMLVNNDKPVIMHASMLV